MKSITESIIGKKGGSQKFRKNMLRSGYIVRYLDDEFGALAMYIDRGIAIPGRPGTIHNIYNAGFYAYSENGNISFMNIDSYEDNLTYSGKYRQFDIIEVWPIQHQPELLEQNELRKLIRDVKSMKINQ